jgi:hypothetical protein
MNPCTHLHKRLYRVPFADGSGYHVAEMCPWCGENVRGVGVWVSHAEAGDPRRLEVWQPRKDDCPLFDGQ